ncbi:hypothetical protein BCR42DRAFT_427694 [Absidia repens]|uniref:Etoposide-induced protein 2.4-domain-containing protein n=1 Tax=Absidia repens TaxID=90262 RepID=A0A1X2HZ56_9FUNG|nr:hypothetical protein BCR42DRAFT_427694 [Absidia repens]
MARRTVHELRHGVYDAIQGVLIVVSNPHLRQHKFLRIFLVLTVLSVVLYGVTHLLVTIPLRIVKYVAATYAGPGHDINKVDGILTTIHRTIIDIISYVPVLALLFMRYVYPKPLDDLFMETLQYIDQLNSNSNNNRQGGDDAGSPHPTYAGAMAKRSYRKEYWPNMKSYMRRTWTKMLFGLVIFLLSFLPRVGQFVIPAAGAYATFRSLSKSQGIVRELLEPYFVRMNMSHSEKKRWFDGRKGILFGFSLIAYMLIRVPYLGFAAAAYILTTVVSVDEINHSLSASRENSIDALQISDKTMLAPKLD